MFYLRKIKITCVTNKKYCTKVGNILTDFLMNIFQVSFYKIINGINVGRYNSFLYFKTCRARLLTQFLHEQPAL